jgi:hypothetical protein
MNTTKNQKLEYQPLEKRDSIRLMILHHGVPDSEIKCTLVHTTIRECRADIYEGYTALSYVWGNPESTKTILVDDQPFQATINLSSALEDLRDSVRPLRIWIDAICIDQANIHERNVQVGLMSDIYSLAQRTVVYLGEDNLVFSEMARQSFESAEEMLAAWKLATKHHGSFAHEILSRPWFSRIWIFQELVLSRDVWVQCGRSRMPWDLVCDILRVTKRSLGGKEEGTESEAEEWEAEESEAEESEAEESEGEKETEVEAETKEMEAEDSKVEGETKETEPEREVDLADGEALRPDGPPFSSIFSMHKTRKNFRMSLINGGEPESLSTVLSSRRGLGVSDLRDMIYAHLAVAGSQSVTDAWGRRVATPVVDYSKSVTDVFVEAASYMFNDSIDTELLRGVEAREPFRRMEGLPSWVPDWSLGQSSLLYPLSTANPYLIRYTIDNKFAESPKIVLQRTRVLASEVVRIGTVHKTSHKVLPPLLEMWLFEKNVYKQIALNFQDANENVHKVSWTAASEDLRKLCVLSAVYRAWNKELGDDFLPPLEKIEARWNDIYVHEGASTIMDRLLQGYADDTLNDIKEILLLHISSSFQNHQMDAEALVGRRLAVLYRPNGIRVWSIVPRATRPEDCVYMIWGMNRVGERFHRDDYPKNSKYEVVVRPCGEEVKPAMRQLVSDQIQKEWGRKWWQAEISIVHSQFVGICSLLPHENITLPFIRVRDPDRYRREEDEELEEECTHIVALY